jgi:hypothetical protein
MLDVVKLEALGFFRHIPADKREGLVRQLGESRDVAATLASLAGEGGGITRRLFWEDPEALAEQGVLDFLGRLAPLLRAAGIHIDVTYAERNFPASAGRPPGRAAAKLGADGWLIEEQVPVGVESLAVAFAPGAKPCALTWDDNYESLLANDREIALHWIDGQDCNDPWACVLQATLGLIDELLSAHESEERATANYTGHNDMVIVIATPAMTRLLNEATKDGEARLLNAREVRALALGSRP